MDYSPLSKVPLLRVLVPFAAGIILSLWLNTVLLPVVCGAAGIALYTALHLASRKPSSRLRTRPFFIAAIALICTALGSAAHLTAEPPVIEEISSQNAASGEEEHHQAVATGRIEDIYHTELSTQITVDLLTIDGNDEVENLTKVHLSTRGCDYTLSPGDVVAFPAIFYELADLGNPDDFDYASMMLERGIRYGAHCNADEVRKIGHSPTLTTRLNDWRIGIEHKILSSTLSPETQCIVIALVLGNDRYIQPSRRNDFAHTGLSHIMALSGLHVAVIATLIWLLLFPLDLLMLRRLRLVITLAALVVFDALTGFPPSAVRATVMIGMVFAVRIFHRQTSPLNALSLAALVILIVSPRALLNAGFQFSFITVGAILAVNPRYSHLWQTRNAVRNFIVATLFTSTVALVATIALTAYYFHTVSLVSTISNIIVLPLFPIYMGLAALFTLLCSAGIEVAALSWLVDHSTSWLTTLTHWIGNASFSHISNIYISTASVALIYAALAFALGFVIYRQRGAMIAAALLLLGACGVIWWQTRHTAAECVVVFNDFSHTPVLYFCNGKGYLWVPDADEDITDDFARRHSGFLAHYGITSLQQVTEPLTLERGFIDGNAAMLCGKRFYAAGRGKWKSMKQETPLTTDYLILTKRYNGDVQTITKVINAETIVLSGDIYTDRRQELTSQLTTHPHIDQKTAGAIVVLNE